ncbi:MAG TPA: hypothetical protein VEQ40_05185 [Pyrinomonadaceae bacterium]|nr:hypothetical protein [Pyrinomonadaceae bacterium]
MRTPTISATDFIRHARSQLHIVDGAIKEVETSQRQHQEQMKALQEARDKALDELVELSLPALTREAFASVASLTGYRQFETNDPFERMERRRQELSLRVVTIEADQRYQRREQLLDPAAGDLILKRNELESQLKIMDETLSRYDAEPEFAGLVHRGYDTEQYSLKWWQLQYYRDWKHGDIITEKFGQQAFRDVLYGYNQVRAGRAEVYQDYQLIRHQIAEIESLVAERSKSLTDLENIEVDTLNACRQQLREHLEYIDRNDLAAWSASDPNRTGLLKRIHGIEKKMEYLDELARRYLDTEREQLLTMKAKLDKKITKYRRPKNAYAAIPVTEANSILKDPRPKLAARRQRYNESYHTVAYYDRYDAFDFTRDMLWWDVMTDGRIDGDFIPEVHAWREQHPGRGAAYDSGLAGADPTYVSSQTDSTGLGSFTDVS